MINLVKKNENLLGECHLGIEKLMSNLYQFRAQKNLQMINSGEKQASETEEFKM